MTGLAIAKGFTLPLDYATATGGILAKKGAGKSNAAVVMAEQMYKAGVPWVAVDPKGDWWGIRSSADGKGPGLSIPVFGGRHGDIPLEPTAGAFLADLVLAERLTCVLDVSEFSRADTRRFLLAFAERLYRQADAEPLHLFLEEAHEYLPQMVRGDDAPLVGAWQRIVKQGRFKGLGVTIISQRSASVNKDVLTQVDTLIMLRTTSPQDRKAVEAWIDVHGDSKDVLATLPSLAAGQAWVWAPEWNMLRQVQFLRRSTFDSGATPKVGEARKAPATLADVDLARIKEQMVETIEKAKADDPKELRKRIKELERELGAAHEREANPLIELREVERLPMGVLLTARTLVEQADRLHGALETFAVVLHKYDESTTELPVVAKQGLVPPQSGDSRARTARPVSAGTTNTPVRESAPRRQGSSPAGADSTITGPQRKLLTVLATYGPRTRQQLAMQAGYVATGGAFRNPLSALRTAGYVSQAEPVAITEAGLEALGEYTPLPTGQALIDHWMAGLSGPCQKLLGAIIAAGEITREDLAATTDYEVTGGAFRNPLSKLRTLGLVERGDPIRLTDEFAEAIA